MEKRGKMKSDFEELERVIKNRKSAVRSLSLIMIVLTFVLGVVFLIGNSGFFSAASVYNVTSGNTSIFECGNITEAGTYTKLNLENMQ